MAITGVGAIARKYFMIFFNVSQTATLEWELIGEKVEELMLNMNPNVSTVTDVLGKTTTSVDKYEVETDVSPFMAKKESKLFKILYDIVKNKKTLSDVEFDLMCVNVFDAEGSNYVAWTQKATIAVQSFGGGTAGLDIPFNVYWTGDQTDGTFNPTTKVFTASTNPKYLLTFSVSGTASVRLAGASILVDGQLLTTDDNGIAYIHLKAADYSYTVSASGYTTGNDNVTVSTGAVFEAVVLTEA